MAVWPNTQPRIIIACQGTMGYTVFQSMLPPPGDLALDTQCQGIARQEDEGRRTDVGGPAHQEFPDRQDTAFVSGNGIPGNQVEIAAGGLGVVTMSCPY